jgi:large subunit ribosomal protein L17
MRHGLHRHLLGRTKEHRIALMSNLAAALFRHGRIETTLAKAKALRPFVEKIITLAKKAQVAEVSADRVHFRRLAVTQVHDEAAVKQLFTERVSEFLNRNGGYTRIYKLVPRRGDAAKLAIIELISGDDKGYKKSRRTARRKPSPTQTLSTTTPLAEDKDDVLKITTDAPTSTETSESQPISSEEVLKPEE